MLKLQHCHVLFTPLSTWWGGLGMPDNIHPFKNIFIPMMIFTNFPYNFNSFEHIMGFWFACKELKLQLSKQKRLDQIKIYVEVLSHVRQAREQKTIHLPTHFFPHYISPKTEGCCTINTLLGYTGSGNVAMGLPGIPWGKP